MKDYDYIVIGSGFGGSVSALRLSEKGYKVLVIEKGKWFRSPEDFPKSNWNLKKWLWLPSLGFKGLFKLTFFRHVAVLSGVGVGGGSLVYANTLPVPQSPFFHSGSWKGLANWEEELKPFYALAKKMLGAVQHPYRSKSEEVMKALAENNGWQGQLSNTDVGVYFGTAAEGPATDPYFDGKGPERQACILCGACMLGCPHNAKNSLDKNYLHLAQGLGAEILAEYEVVDLIPLGPNGQDGYRVECRSTAKPSTKSLFFESKGVVFAGGVLGTTSLLMKLKSLGRLPQLSPRIGAGIRTNSESLIGVTSFEKNANFSKGIAIGSILNIDEQRSLEPVKYPEGAGFWRLFMAPMVQGSHFLGRLGAMIKDLLWHPISNFKAFFIDDWSKRTQILLYMESIDTELQFKRSSLGYSYSKIEHGKAPTAFNPMAHALAKQVEDLVGGKAMVMASETLFGIPSTAHILGGACMGANADEGVIDAQHRVYHYENLYVCDGSAISANIGVNPSLTITALSERAMSFIPEKK